MNVGNSHKFRRALTMIKQSLEAISAEYSPQVRERKLRDIPRTAYHIAMIYGKGKRVLDIGGGIGLFSVGCAALSMESFLLDDFSDEIYRKEGDSGLDLHKKYGVTILKGDASNMDLPFENGFFDVVNSVDCIEHFHRSPRRLFHQVKRVLKKDGIFFLSLPNAADILNRLKLLFGISNWSRFEDWYYPEEFRGHVREATCSDLRRIAKDCGFTKLEIFGKNWQLRGKLPPFVSIPIDKLLQIWPSFCSGIYLIATK